MTAPPSASLPQRRRRAASVGSRAAAPRLHLALLWWLLASLLLSQTLGLMHGVVHGPWHAYTTEAGVEHLPTADAHGLRHAPKPAAMPTSRAAAVPVGGLAGQAPDADLDDHAAHGVHADAQAHGVHIWVEGLFGQHDKPTACVLFDQSSHGDAAPGFVALALPLQLLSFFLDVFAAPAPWFAAVFHQARAPPLFR